MFASAPVGLGSDATIGWPTAVESETSVLLRLLVGQLIDDVFHDGVGIGKYAEDNVASRGRAYGDIARDH
jgi:hypothetical protein